MKFLHILKDADSREALEMIRGGEGPPSEDLAVVLMQDASSLNPETGSTVFVLKDGERASAVSGAIPVDYKKLLDLIFKAEKVVVW